MVSFIKQVILVSVFSISSLAFSCEEFNAIIDADVVDARMESYCVITAHINYVKRPHVCPINIVSGSTVEIIAPQHLLSSGCPVDGGLFMEGNIKLIKGTLILTSGEVW